MRYLLLVLCFGLVSCADLFAGDVYDDMFRRAEESLKWRDPYGNPSWAWSHERRDIFIQLKPGDLELYNGSCLEAHERAEPQTSECERVIREFRQSFLYIMKYGLPDWAVAGLPPPETDDEARRYGFERITSRVFRRISE